MSEKETTLQAVADPAAVRTLDGMDVPAPGEWEIDPAHSEVTFVSRHLMVAKVRGRFTRFSGTLTVGETPEASSVEVEIDPSSIDTGNEMRDGHLRTADFFEVERFPKMVFRSTKVERSGERSLRMVGDLTIRDVTKPVTLDVEYLGLGTDHRGSPRAFFSASGEIDREAWGITWNQVIEGGGVMIGKHVRLEIEVQATPRAAALAA